MKNDEGSFEVDSTLTHNVPGGASDGKTLRIIDYFPIPHADVMKLFECSEPETLITGNQSCGEAVSASKVFFYETLPNDTNFGQQMVGLSGQIDGGFQATMKKMQCFEGAMDHESIAAALKDPDTRKCFERYGAKVREEFDLSKRLELKVKRKLVASEFPSIKQDLAKVDEQIAKLCDEEQKIVDESSERRRPDKPILMPEDRFESTVESVAHSMSSLVNTLEEMNRSA